MPSITSWMRLEPRSRDTEMQSSLQARIYDPLWMLARQWQLGEFAGQDNGSPVTARWRGEAGRLSRYHAGTIAPDTIVDAAGYDARRMPLETLVERETVRPPHGQAAPERLRLAAEAGQQFLRILGRQPLARDYRAGFIARYAFVPLSEQQQAALDEHSRDFLALMAPRLPDGRRLHRAFRSRGADRIVIEPELEVAPADLAEVEKAARLWLEWFETMFSEPEDGAAAWLPERMEYAFSVASRLGDGERTLTAQEYYAGHLDWHAFDVNAEVSLGATTDDNPSQITRTVMPAPVSYRGMPAPRFWEFEDAQVDWGSVDAGPTDLARMLLVEFALTYGDDWFVIPLELEVGALYRTRSLVITDTFGVRTLIGPSGAFGMPHRNWHMFQHSFLRGSEIAVPESNLLLLPPALLTSVESRPLEEVLFVRDEMANLAWAVERTVESASGEPLDRYGAYARRQAEPAQHPPAASEAQRYRLTTEVPDYWIPLLPVRTAEGLRLQRGAVLSTDGVPRAAPAVGRILNVDGGRSLELYEEEVPREGVRVIRAYQYTRWIDGSTHVWVGRRKGIGRGEGSSGLRFDTIEDAEAPG